MENVSGENDPVAALFDQFCHASTCKSIISTFQQLCDRIGLRHADHRHFYRRFRARISSWKAQALWLKLDKRASHKEYRKGEACANTRVIIIGGGICGLRAAIEVALLGAKAVVIEKRDRFSRNNVLHLWPYLITDLKNLGAKKFFGKFCAGAIDHISIRQLQCILLKAALVVGVEVHVNVGFLDIIEPTTASSGWRVKVDPENHPVSEYEFDVLIGADGKRNTLAGFKRKEFRGKLAIAITANFINSNTQAEARVEEISGVAFIFNQKFFKDLNEQAGIDLENIVYYKDETHYFVMTAKKQSLMDKGVLKRDYSDTAMLLQRDNVNQEALANYAREAADFSTNHQLPHLNFAVNHYGQADLAMFDFTSLFQAENASRVVERLGHKLLMILVGDSLLEPFWPTGSGCARGFLGCLDAAWMIKLWSSGRMTPLEVIAERESVYQFLSQTTPENLQKNHNLYTIDPITRYSSFGGKWLRPDQVMHLYDTGEAILRDEVIELPTKRPGHDIVDTYSLLRWCQKLLNTGSFHTIHVADLSSSWKTGLAFCALLHCLKPECIEYDSLNEADVAKNSQLAFDTAQREFGINPVMSGEDLATCDKPDKLTIVSYLAQFQDLFKKQRLHSAELLNSSFEENRKHRSPGHRMSLLQKLRSRASLSKLKKSKKDKDIMAADEQYHKSSVDLLNKSREREMNEIPNGDIPLTRYNKLPMDEIRSRLTVGNTAAGNKGDKGLSRLPMEQIAERLTTGNQLPDTKISYRGLTKLPIDSIASKLTANTCAEDGKTKDVAGSRLPIDEIASKLTGNSRLEEVKVSREMTNIKVSAMAEILVSKLKGNVEQAPHAAPGKRVKGQPTMLASEPSNEFCFFCKKRVYLMERMSVESVFFHRQCFKCDFCGTTLRSTNYACDRSPYGDAVRFFCYRHSHPRSRLSKPHRKRSFKREDGLEDDVFKENIPTDAGPTPTKVSTPARPEKKSPVALLSPISAGVDLSDSLKTPERIEFENTIEGLPEETEEEQYEHNLRASMSSDALLANLEGEEEDSDSDLDELLSECSDYEVAQMLGSWSGEEDFQEAVDLYKSGRLEESICLAKESLRRSEENLVDMRREGYQMLNGEEEEEEEDTEMEYSDYETDEDEDTEREEETTESSSLPVETKAEPPVESVPTTQPTERKPSVPPVSPGTSSKARVDWFCSPPEVVRLDPWKMFGMGKKAGEKSLEEPAPVVEVESDEATDRQVLSGTLDQPAEERKAGVDTDEDLDEVFKTAEYEAVDEEEQLEKTAVSRAMEQLLVDMDHRSSASSSTDMRRFSSEEEEELASSSKRLNLSKSSSSGSRSGTGSGRMRSRSSSDFDKEKHKSGSRSSGEGGKQPRSRSSSEFEKRKASSGSDFGDTEKSVLRSVKQMSDYSSSGTGDTTLQDVLKSVEEMKEPDADFIEKRIQYLDDRFVTRTRGDRNKKRSKKSNVRKSSSSDSFTISTPSHSSKHSSSSSLSEELEYNRPFLQDSDDEKPDEDMLRDYQLTLSHALGEDSDELSPRADSGKEEEDLDETLNAEDSAVSPRSEARSSVSEYLSPMSARNSSVYETPNSSLTEQNSQIVQQAKPTDTTKSRKSSSLSKGSGKKKKTLENGAKPPKVIRQVSRDSTEGQPAPHSTKTIIRPYRHASREGSVEPNTNPLERDAWGSRSSSCSSVSEASQKNWRPLPPVPKESSSSPKMSKAVKHGTGRKLPDTTNLKSKNPPTSFQSQFMKKAVGSPLSSRKTDENDNSNSGNTAGSAEGVETGLPITTQPRALPTKPFSTAATKKEEPLKSPNKTKINVDYSRLQSFSDKDSSGGVDSDSKKKKIPVDNAVKKSIKSKLNRKSSVEEEDIDDIPFADDSEDDLLAEKFYTPATSVKPHVKIQRDGGHRDARKRILPVTPREEPGVLSPDHIRDIRKAEIEKARETAREKARLKSDEELGLGNLGCTPGLVKMRERSASRETSTENELSSHSTTPSVGDRVSDSDDLKTPALTFNPSLPTSNGTPRPSKDKKKKKKSKDKVDEVAYISDPESKKKKRSLLASLFVGKTPTEKSRIKDRDRSSSTDTLDEKSSKKKKSKTPKSEKKKDKKKRRSEAQDSEDALSDNMKGLKIGYFTDSVKKPGMHVRTVPPKAYADEDLSDSDIDTSVSSLPMDTRRIKSDHGPMSEEELNAKITRKIQQAARKQQKQQEQKRLRQAQEIQRKLEEADVKQRELEERGVVVERALRGEGTEAHRAEPDLMQDWFNLVHEKNALVRLESELMVSARELELEDRQGRLQQQLRESMAVDDRRKSTEQQSHEQKVYNELIDVVEERDKLVAMLEEERLREREEDKDLENVMRAKGFSLSPQSGSKILRNSRGMKAS